MATTVHVPPALLAAVDRRARALDVSRNRLIIRALERELREGADWSPGFFDRVADVDADTAAAVDELDAVIRRGRRSKPAPRL